MTRTRYERLVLKFRTLIFCASLGLTPIVDVRADEPALPSVATLEALVSEYVQIRSAQAREKREWAEQEKQWRSETELLETEKTQLQEELDRLSEQETRLNKEQAEQQARQSMLDTAIEALPPLLDQAEARLRQWRRRIPPPLSEQMDQAFREIPAEPPAARREDTLRRLQRVVALYAQIEQLQARIHAVKERLPVDATARREVDVLYLGLARAFAVSTDNQWAATGYPTDSGWIWESDPKLAESVRRAIEVHNRQAEAQFVTLPMRLSHNE